MIRLIISFFRGLSSLFRGTNRLAQEAGEALESSVESFGKTIDEMVKSSDAKHAIAIEKYKKEKAQLVIDRGYESEEAMDNYVKELVESIKKKNKL